MNLTKFGKSAKIKYTDFIQTPIPQEFLFDGVDDYLKPIRFRIYTDPQYIESVLIPHFAQSSQDLELSLAEHRNELLKARSLAQNSISLSQDFSNVDKLDEINFLNCEIVRILKVLLPKNEEMRRTELFTRLSFLEQRIETLEKLEKLAKYLLKFPRYCFLSLKSATRKLYNATFELLPDLFFESEAIEKYATSLKSQLALIPKPFSNNKENIIFVRHIVSLGVAMRDPTTKVVPQTEEFEIFRRFLESKESPFNISQYKSKEMEINTLLIRVNEMKSALINFCGLENSKDLNKISDVFENLLIRFLFEQNYETVSDLDIVSNSKITENLSQMSKLPLKDIDINSSQFPERFLDKTAKELFETEPFLKSLSGELLSCHFLVNPIDMFFVVKKIGFSLAAFVSENRKEMKLKTKKYNDFCLSWKLLFVAAEVPALDALFEWMENWKMIPMLAASYEKVCKVPKLVLKGLAK